MDLEMYGVSAVVLIIAVVQLLKGAGLPAKYAGLAAVALGLAAAWGFGAPAGWPVMQIIVTGLMLGLSAAGLYSTQKNVRE